VNTLLLDQTLWDLCKDAAGDIAVASDPYAIAQDAASAMRLFAGELWYNTTKGIPYFEQILGHSPPVGVLKGELIQASLSVPGVVGAKVFISSVADRTVTGQVQLDTVAGVVVVSGSLDGSPLIVSVT